MTDELPYDTAAPPADPPPGANPLIWRLAYALREAHQPRGDGFCGACRTFVPCDDARLAAEGLQSAIAHGAP